MHRDTYTAVAVFLNNDGTVNDTEIVAQNESRMGVCCALENYDAGLCDVVINEDSMKTIIKNEDKNTVYIINQDY